MTEGAQCARWVERALGLCSGARDQLCWGWHVTQCGWAVLSVAPVFGVRPWLAGYGLRCEAWGTELNGTMASGSFVVFRGTCE